MARPLKGAAFARSERFATTERPQTAPGLGGSGAVAADKKVWLQAPWYFDHTGQRHPMVDPHRNVYIAHLNTNQLHKASVATKVANSPNKYAHTL